jgi:sugar phosphate isomerase/epimerase
MKLSRRALLKRAATAPAALALAAATQRYQLGCMTMLYRAHSFPRALAGIRQAGFQYVVPGRSHAGKEVFAAKLSSTARTEVQNQMKEHGLKPIMSLGGFNADLNKPGGLNDYLAEIDLCAEFGIPVMVGGGPWYFQKFPNLPKRDRDWQREVADFYTALEKAVRHAESAKVIVALKPHTGITARAKDCLEVVKRLPSPWLRICWDAGNVSFYEGIYPDPDLPDLAPYVKGVCIKDHAGVRGEANFPVPGTGQIDHESMFRTLFAAGFDGPMAVERLEGKENLMRMPAEDIDARVAASHKLLTGFLERTSSVSG